MLHGDMWSFRFDLVLGVDEVDGTWTVSALQRLGFCVA